MQTTKILVIEDDESVRENLKELLFACDYDVVTARNGLEGLEKVSKHKPSLILCDINMPELDGIELLQILRKNPATYSTPFLFLTALTDVKIQRKGMSLGADDFITKPYESNDLLAAIKSKIEKYAAIKKSFQDVTDNLEKQKSNLIPFQLLTPLNSLKGFIQVLLNTIDEVEKEDIVSILQILNNSSDRIIKLLENYSLYMKLGDTKAFYMQDSFESINIKKAISNKITYFQNIYSIKGLNIISNLEDCFICMNPLHLEKLISEILENTFRYSFDNRTILFEGKSYGESYTFKSENYSRGINQKFLDKLDTFDLSEIPESEHQSNGLGLALVKKITECYNGSFNINSIPYEYTTVEVVLPVNIAK